MIIHHNDILGVVLAGGQNRRMGEHPKWLLPLGDKSMMEHILARFSPQVAELILNGNNNALTHYGYPVVGDTVANFQGPLAGLLAGLSYAKAHGYTWVASCPCDSPFLPTDYVDTLARAITLPQHLCSIASRQGKIHAVFGLWSVTLLDTLQHTLHHSNSRSMHFWASQLPVPAINVDFPVHNTNIDPFFNINTPNEWQASQPAFSAP
jgi:molybdenum cofactor guanylyltransferase